MQGKEASARATSYPSETLLAVKAPTQTNFAQAHKETPKMRVGRPRPAGLD